MTNSLAQWFAQTMGGKVSPELIIFIVSMIPILELRGGLIVASLLEVNMWKAIPICIVGNLIPVPIILLLILKIFDLLRDTKHFGRAVNALERRALNNSDRIKKSEFIGLVLFVGIPLPGTGAWTGSLIAALLGVKPKKAFLAIFLGILMATVIMCIVSYGMLGAIIR